MSDEMKEHRRGRLAWLSSEVLEKQGIVHGFTLRYGGVSRGGFASLNFTSRQGDLPERVGENWRRIEEAAALPPGGWALVSQIHGAAVVEAAGGRSHCHHRNDCPPADALVAADPGVTLGVLTADCLSAVLAAPGGGAVAVAHAGWRGTLLGVLPETVLLLCRTAKVEPGELRAVLGPVIGPCCFQVGEEVRRTFAEHWGEGFARRIFRASDPWHLDLAEANRIQLLDAGLADGKITAAGLCTVCRSDLFFSHRRDGERTGRMLAFAAPAPGEGKGQPISR
jgi:hypothetical protein